MVLFQYIQYPGILFSAVPWLALLNVCFLTPALVPSALFPRKKKTKVGLRLGHGTRHGANQATITFVTTGYLVRLFANSADALQHHTHLIIDEVCSFLFIRSFSSCCCRYFEHTIYIHFSIQCFMCREAWHRIKIMSLRVHVKHEGIFKGGSGRVGYFAYPGQ